jgi:hypothetical protein
MEKKMPVKKFHNKLPYSITHIHTGSVYILPPVADDYENKYRKEYFQLTSYFTAKSP